MLRLTWEQQALLDQLIARRHAEGIAAVLGQAWPALVERLAGRWPAFVEAAVQQGRQHGFEDARDLARYASLWCVWGPAFDGKPAFAWAQEILADPRRAAPLKLHQLAHRTRDELQRLHAASGTHGKPSPDALSGAQFDAVLQRIDEAIGPLAAARSVFPPEPGEAPRVVPCDIATIDLVVVEPDGLEEYRLGTNGWQRAQVARTPDPALHWTHAPDEPVSLALVSRPLRKGAPARLNLRIEPHAACDPRTHPEVVHVGAEGHLAWKGRDATRLSLAVYADADAMPGGALTLPSIAAPTPFDAQTVTVSSCGLRDAGAPFGPVSLALRVYPGAQHKLEIGHPAWPPMAWPPQESVAAPAPSVRLERDGEPVDARAWQQHWARLHTLLQAGFERVYNEWVRVLDAQATRLDVDASALVGQAGLAWGWRRTGPDLVQMRTQAALDLIAFACDLTLVGEIVDGDARSRLRLRCQGREELRATVQQTGETAPERQGLKDMARSFRFPLTLEVDPLAEPSAASLVAAAVPQALTGALVGECGLRPRTDGPGHQWHFSLRLEPVTLVVDGMDPLLGRTRRQRPLLPEIKLVEWSAG